MKALTLIAALVLVGACQSDPQGPPEPLCEKDAQAQIFDFREKLDDDPAKCVHAWQQTGLHSYTRWINGMPSVDLCAINRCLRCGSIRHECQGRR